MGYFGITLSLFLKASLGAQLFINMQVQLIFI